jgi:hypothetical protein
VLTLCEDVPHFSAYFYALELFSYLQLVFAADELIKYGSLILLANQKATAITEKMNWPEKCMIFEKLSEVKTNRR